MAASHGRAAAASRPLLYRRGCAWSLGGRGRPRHGVSEPRGRRSYFAAAEDVREWIFSVDGCSTPLVLRSGGPSASGHFNVIGAPGCYANKSCEKERFG